MQLSSGLNGVFISEKFIVFKALATFFKLIVNYVYNVFEFKTSLLELPENSHKARKYFLLEKVT